MNSKQRAAFRAAANGIPTIVQIGKGGITDTLIGQIDGALNARELIKVGLLESAPMPVREAADGIGQQVGAEVIQVIGSKFVLYRVNPDKDKKPAKKSAPKSKAGHKIPPKGRPDFRAKDTRPSAPKGKPDFRAKDTRSSAPNGKPEYRGKDARPAAREFGASHPGRGRAAYPCKGTGTGGSFSRDRNASVSDKSDGARRGAGRTSFASRADSAHRRPDAAKARPHAASGRSGGSRPAAPRGKDSGGRGR